MSQRRITYLMPAVSSDGFSPWTSLPLPRRSRILIPDSPAIRAHLRVPLRPTVSVMSQAVIRRRFLVSQTLENLQRLAPRWEHAPAALLVPLHGPHALYLGLITVFFTGGRVDESPPPAG